MNKSIFMGRITNALELKESEELKVLRFQLALNRRTKNGENVADYPSCVAFGNIAESIYKNCSKGTKILVTARVQTGSYKNKEDVTIYTTDFVIEEWEFTEKKPNSEE